MTAIGNWYFRIKRLLKSVFHGFKALSRHTVKSIPPVCERFETRQLLSAVPTVIPAAAATIPRYDHVVVVVEENHSYNQILGPSIWPPSPEIFYPSIAPSIFEPFPMVEDPYIRTLAKQGASFTNSHALTHPSQPNYLDLFSGSNLGVTSDATPRQHFAGPSLGGELLANGLSFTGYSESIPKVGYQGGDKNGYVRHHNPWTNFTDVPAADSLSTTRFPRDFNQLPTVSFVIPNLYHDMHSGSTQTGDRWLQKHMKRYANWAKKHNSLLIVTWDESAGDRANTIPTIFYGAHVKRGPYREQINHFNVLRTVEDMYGLAPTGSAAQATPIADVFTG